MLEDPAYLENTRSTMVVLIYIVDWCLPYLRGRRRSEETSILATLLHFGMPSSIRNITHHRGNNTADRPAIVRGTCYWPWVTSSWV